MASRGGVDVMSLPQDTPAYAIANGGKRKLEDSEFGDGAKKVKADAQFNEAPEAALKAVEGEHGEERAVVQRTAVTAEGACTASEQTAVYGEPAVKRLSGAVEATPSCSEVEVKEEEEEEEEEAEEGGGKTEDVRQSGEDSRRESETPPPAEEPRVKRGASKKATVNRALNSKNFLKSILPNITRLSRTEVLYDIKVMDGTTRMRTDRSERDRS